MLSIFTRGKGAKAEATAKPLPLVTMGSEVPAPRTCPDAQPFRMV